MRAAGYTPSHRVENTSRLPSQTIWNSCPWTSIKDGMIEGSVLWDDFTFDSPNFGSADATTNNQKWGSWIDSGGTIAPLAGFEYGAVVLTTSTTDNDAAMIISGGGDGGHVNFIAPDTAVPHDIWMETRFKIDDITTGNWFVGFAQPGVDTSDGLITDTANTYAAVDYVGFHVLEGDPDGLDFVYNDSGSADQVGINAMDTMVADTYVKVGLHYSYANPDAQMCRIFLNGQLQTTYVSKSTINGATWPSGADMCFVAMVKNSSGAANVMTLDWVKIAQRVN